MKKILIFIVMCMMFIPNIAYAYTGLNYIYHEKNGYKYNESLSGGNKIVFTNFIEESVAIISSSNGMKFSVSNIGPYASKNTKEQIKEFKASNIEAVILEEGVKKLGLYDVYCTKLDITNKKAYQVSCIIPQKDYIYQVIISTTKKNKIKDKELEKVLDNLVLPGYENQYQEKDYSRLKTITLVVVGFIILIALTIIIMFKMTGHTIFRRF